MRASKDVPRLTSLLSFSSERTPVPLARTHLPDHSPCVFASLSRESTQGADSFEAIPFTGASDVTSSDPLLNPPHWFNATNPMRRDTIVVPAGGAVNLQWVADNPGAWIL